MAKEGKKTLECLLPEELVDAVDAIVKARNSKRAYVVADMIRAYIDPLPRLQAAAFTAENARHIADGFNALTGFIESAVAAFAENEALKEENVELRQQIVDMPEFDGFQGFDGPDFAPEPVASSTLVKPSW
ncbi:hypothetical protein HFO91_30795 [Rhizobium leguminosarum]|uniref:ribbon-helix-helix domain-containing protein n=1 Tax=Rhizobium leguminosarum TaxID=384 RepID=UPI001C950FB6|nr:ribbon-helix-helix domain-containing protein [Rhizobium leguminosarum]MBY5453969.1 hypothetical protein [Rhizobium leguminosarum]